MLIITIDGPSKSGKSKAASHLFDVFSKRMVARLGVGGNFFRALTAFVFADLGVKALENSPKEKIEAAIKSVLKDNRLYDPSSLPGDLHSGAIERAVSTIGGYDIAQVAANEWFARLAREAEAAGVELLLIEGRNPRAKLARAGFAVALDIYYTCDEKEAARRNLSDINPSFSAEDLKQETSRISERRRKDATRTTNPLRYPANPVTVRLDARTDAHDVASHAAWESLTGAPAKELPRTIVLDNTNSPTAVTLKVSELLVEHFCQPQ